MIGPSWRPEEESPDVRLSKEQAHRAGHGPDHPGTDARPGHRQRRSAPGRPVRPPALRQHLRQSAADVRRLVLRRPGPHGGSGDYLRSRGIRAVFFLINEFASQYPGITETLRAQGHWVGNHTYSHRRLPDLPEADARAEIRDGLDSTLLRPPFGDYGDRETRIASELGYRMCTWTVDTLDWDGSGGVSPTRPPYGRESVKPRRRTSGAEWCSDTSSPTSPKHCRGSSTTSATTATGCAAIRGPRRGTFPCP
ncbi:polysaccharide deacetylase family protein [Streptomyces olivoreticuli]|nr:polysaccharide deacetylase family protein [Streptomyces olivoreticuli]WKK24155.1 polysaccharide deacetylase family protein [Streptomyces olivoreticuli]